MSAAQQAAGYEVADLYDHLCSRALVAPTMGAGRTPDPPDSRQQKNFHAEPVKVFDNLYYLGEKYQSGLSPSAWAITTSDGIVMLDALHADSVQDEIINGMPKVGLDPKNIKYVIVTHAHEDHYGGAPLLQDTYHAKVIMSDVDWNTLAQMPPGRGGAKPTKDIAVTDGQKMTFGDETITFYVTPGHTPGTMSILIPVKDHGQPHLAFIWGGTGMQYNMVSYGEQAERMKQIVAKAGADVLISTHPQLDHSDIKLRLVERRQAGDPNPYVVGNDVVQRYLTVARECSAVAQALGAAPVGVTGTR